MARVASSRGPLAGCVSVILSLARQLPPLCTPAEGWRPFGSAINTWSSIMRVFNLGELCLHKFAVFSYSVLTGYTPEQYTKTHQRMLHLIASTGVVQLPNCIFCLNLEKNKEKKALEII